MMCAFPPDFHATATACTLASARRRRRGKIRKLALSTPIPARLSPGFVRCPRSLPRLTCMSEMLRRVGFLKPAAGPGARKTITHVLIHVRIQESERMAVNPTRFCHAFKDWEGQPTNLRVQMDTQEFFNLLFDRIDTHVKDTPLRFFLLGLFFFLDAMRALHSCHSGSFCLFLLFVFVCCLFHSRTCHSANHLGAPLSLLRVLSLSSLGQ